MFLSAFGFILGGHRPFNLGHFPLHCFFVFLVTSSAEDKDFGYLVYEKENTYASSSNSTIPFFRAFSAFFRPFLLRAIRS
jgi:hypothetical protein